MAKKLCLSYSVLQRLAGIRKKTDLGGSIAFYDIETDMDTKKFMFGVVNSRIFSRPAELVEEIMRYDICAGFNNFRFDNEYLNMLCPSEFVSCRMPGFVLHKLRGCINLDLLPAFNLWRPLEASHQLNQLADVLGYERKCSLDDPKGKCFEDVDILRRFWPYAREIYEFVESHFLIDPETLSTTYHKKFSYSKLRRWFLQSWALQRGIYPALVKRESRKKPTYFYYCRPGFYRDINVFDVKSAYPSTAIRLNSTIWETGDFAEYEREMIRLRSENPKIEKFIKWVCNATIGDFNYRDGLLYDRRLMAEVWTAFKKVMEKWVRKIGLENIVYSFTDCVYTHLDSVPQPGDYEISVKHRFRWVAIFNQQRLIGLTDEGKFHRVHFNRPVRLKLFDAIDRHIDAKLLDDPVWFFRNPDWLKFDFDDFKPEDFAIVVFKKDDVCRNIEYLEIWDELDFGLNNVYLSKKGVTVNKDEICYDRYRNWIEYYLNLYRGLPICVKKRKSGVRVK